LVSMKHEGGGGGEVCVKDYKIERANDSLSSVSVCSINRVLCC